REGIMTAWYKTGTADVENASATVLGTDTAWLSMVKPGDAISFDAGLSWLEVASVESNTELTLAEAYPGSTDTGLNYAVMRTSPEWRNASLLFSATAELLARLEQGFDTLGINATPDGDKRLAVAANESFLSYDEDGTDGHIVRVNK